MQIQNLNKMVENKTIIGDLTLSFYYGAKIGILGGNGAGKSTLLRIMAGEDKDIDGKVWLNPGTKIGYVPQEPLLDAKLTVRQVVEQGMAEQLQLVKDFEAVSASLEKGLDDDAMQAALDRMAALQEKIDQTNAWETDRQVENGGGATGAPPRGRGGGRPRGGGR